MTIASSNTWKPASATPSPVPPNYLFYLLEPAKADMHPDRHGASCQKEPRSSDQGRPEEKSLDSRKPRKGKGLR